MNFLTEITAPIVSFVELRWFSSQEEASAPGIDMGNGQILPAEDVLDGHYRRLTDPMTSANFGASTPPARASEQKADRSLQPAIQKLSPELSPLVDLAADLAEQTQVAHPTPQFRQNLHDALERAHQEQAVKRMLGIQPEALREPWWPYWLNGWSMLLIGVPTVVGLFIVFRLCFHEQHRK